MSQTKPQVVTRFAPSPTGFLHIGGARTALFNWLFARANGGTYRLRIEDTDRARSTDEAIAAIHDGLDWLELGHDDAVVMQSQRADRHVEVVNELLSAGRAYRCYATPNELEDMRSQAQAENRPPIYDGRWRDRDPSDAPDDIAPAIRLKADRDGETVIEDAVQGTVTFANENLDDLILLRSDGTPTYMLAVVVDDHDMGVTHVIRGDDHLNNAARQAQIIKALGWPMPTYAHIPLIHGADGAKLSKRHGALGVDAYRAMGFLPEAMRSYLVRLGWSHGDDEIFTTQQLIDWFGLDAVNKAPARFDVQKLEHVNGQIMRDLPANALTARLRAFVNGHIETDDNPLRHATDDDWERIEHLIPALAERAATLNDLAENAAFLVADQTISVDEKASKHLSEEGRTHLAAIAEIFNAVEPWTAETVEAAIRAYVSDNGLKLGQVAQPLRSALVGKTSSPGIFDVVSTLGKATAIERAKRQI